MSDKPEFPFERRHREEAEKRSQISESAERSDQQKQDRKRWIKLGVAIRKAAREIQLYREEQEEDGSKKRRLEWVSLGVLLVTAGMTLFTYLIFRDQLTQMKIDSEINQKHTWNERRAWIEFWPMPNAIKFEPDRPLSIEIRIANMGKTAARDVKGVVVIERRTASQSPSFNETDKTG
jgi:hypothetical protein